MKCSSLVQVGVEQRLQPVVELGVKAAVNVKQTASNVRLSRENIETSLQMHFMPIYVQTILG